MSAQVPFSLIKVLKVGAFVLNVLTGCFKAVVECEFNQKVAATFKQSLVDQMKHSLTL